MNFILSYRAKTHKHGNTHTHTHTHTDAHKDFDEYSIVTLYKCTNGDGGF